MFVVPVEYSHNIDLSQRSHKCSTTYNQVVENYLFSYKVLLKKLPNDVVKNIMGILDPRKDIHVFGLCSGKIEKCKNYLTLNTCPRCFLKVSQKNILL